MYNATDQIRRIIYMYNFGYMMQKNIIDANILMPSIQEMCRIGMQDMAYWENAEIDFVKAYKQMENVLKAEKRKDVVGIYDRLNYEIWGIVRQVLEVLFHKDSNILSNYFWEENREALKIRFPEILKQIGAMPKNDFCKNVRDYGLRGKVVYREYLDSEIDLYSAYGANGFNMMKNIDYRKYNKIYVWGCNGGAEINEIVLMSEEAGLLSEIYVTDLYEFKQILSNTCRKGVLLDSRIEWKFSAEVNDLVKSFDMLKKEISYIYVCNSAKNRQIVNDFIYTHSLNSNIGDSYEQYFDR